ncbi:MAG: LTA synthase family protein, partial [Dokdonella sp.]
MSPAIIGVTAVSALAWSGVLLLALSALALWLDPALSATATMSVVSSLRLVVLNAVPAAVIAIFVFALSRRVIASFAFAGAVYAATISASSIKLAQLGMPLLPADFRFLGTTGGVALFSHYVDFAQVIVPFGLLAVGALALRFEPRIWHAGPYSRAALGSVAVGAAVTLLAGASGWRATYDGWNSGFEPWSPAETVARMGVSPTLLMYHWELSRPDRKPPDRDRVLEFVSEHSAAFAANSANAAGEASAVLPDIIVVQSESFFDTARMNGVSSALAIPNFHRLAARGWAGEMRVPTYAGGTIRTEFEVLSGVPLAAFPGVEYPYFELIDAPMPGLMSVLVEQGYTTTVLHPNDAGFWNRRDALARLGAQRFLALPEFANAPKSGLFIADSALTDRVLVELAEDGPPQFLFAISIEAHGPYEVSPGLDAATLAAITVPDSLDEYGQRTLRHFTYHMSNAV